MTTGTLFAGNAERSADLSPVLGYISKSYKLADGDEEVWKPFLQGAIRLNDPGEVYQPFIFLCGNGPEGPPSSAWFCYYKDLRDNDGYLKMGHGPGGPPVLLISTVYWLAKELKRRKLG